MNIFPHQAVCAVGARFAVKPGDRIGRYEILEAIGAGGMGEVFRARDSKLDRDVALKVLPSRLAGDQDRLLRFEREAKAVAALSHPNILEIHDFAIDDGTAYAVTELLEGETLRQRLESGPLPIRKVSEVGAPIALGLAAAHDKGVVHRDLKPENIFLTRDGRVKILDFGLASLQLSAAAANQTESPTVTRHTDPGTVLGTVGYMSPEQVRGEPVDGRSDVFSLGSILYEMTTGVRAFQRDTAAETMTAILREDPPEPDSSVSRVTPGLDRIVRHCLEKQPAERFQSARDLAFQLDSVSDASGVTPSADPGKTPVRRRWLSPAVIGLALAAGAVAGALGAAAMLSRPEPTEIELEKVTTRRGRVSSARFSADGRSVLYGASWDGQPVEIFTTSVANPLEWRPLGLENADLLSVSAKGELAISLGRKFVAGWETSGTLALVPQGGGAPRPLIENVLDAEWDPAGAELAVVRQVDGRYRLEYPAGTVLYETEGWIESIRFNPTGDRIAFIDHPLRGDNVGDIAVVETSGAGLQRLAPGGHSLVWSADGGEVWTSFGSTVSAVDLSGHRRIVYRAPGALWIQDVSADGRVLMSSQDHRREMSGLPPGEATERDLSWFDWSTPQAISDDGQVVLFDEGNTWDEFGYWIYIRGTGGSPPVRLGSGMGMDLSPDGRWVLSLGTPFSDPHFALLPTGPGARRPLPPGSATPQGMAGFLPDGEHFVFAGEEAGGTTRLYLRSLDGSTERAISPPGLPLTYNAFSVSPDGRFIAAPDRNGDLSLYPTSGGEPQPVQGVESGEAPIEWGSGSDALYVFRPGELPARLFKVDVASGRRTPWLELAPADTAGVASIDFVWMSQDGSSYVYSFKRQLSQLYLVDGLR